MVLLSCGSNRLIQSVRTGDLLILGNADGSARNIAGRAVLPLRCPVPQLVLRPSGRSIRMRCRSPAQQPFSLLRLGWSKSPKGGNLAAPNGGRIDLAQRRGGGMRIGKTGSVMGFLVGGIFLCLP